MSNVVIDSPTQKGKPLIIEQTINHVEQAEAPVPLSTLSLSVEEDF